MTVTLIKPHHLSKYTAAEIERGLACIAMCSGNMSAAHKMVNAEGTIKPARKTMERWRDAYPERLQEIREKIAPQLKRQLADAHQDMAARIIRIEEKTVTELEKRLPDMQDRDMVNMAKAAAYAGSIHVEKMRLLRDEPTTIERRELSDVVRALASKGVTIDGTAVEVSPHPADVKQINPSDAFGKQSQD